MSKKEVFAWGMYDLANTIFSALFVTFFFPFFIKTFLGGNEFQIGLVFGTSMLFVAISVPIIGALSDRINARMPFIIFFTILCCTATALVAKVPLYLALIVGGIANYCYHAALTTYNALLPAISNRKNIGRVSAIGIGMGYLGTVIALIIAALLLAKLGWETKVGSQSMFVATAVMFFVFSLPTFFGIKEPGSSKAKITHIKGAFKSVGATLSNLRRHKSVLWFLGGMFFYINAINAVILFLFLFARQQIGLTVKGFFLVYAVQSVAAAIGSFSIGKVIDRFGAKKVLVWAGWLWMLVVMFFLFVKTLWGFVLVGSLGGVALGVVWAAQRPKLVELVAKENVGQFFGFQQLTDKFSGVIGPVLFGWLVVVSGYTAALLSLLAFFLIGLFFLRRVPADNLH